MKKPKILLYDFESTPNLAYTWGKYDQTVLDFVKERELLCMGYTWLGSDRTECLTRKGYNTDEGLVAVAADILAEADITIAHNGDEFDRKLLKTRMLAHNMKPLKINCSVDTKKAAKLYFNFNGNSLDDLMKFLGIGRKQRLPGISAWLDCMKDDFNGTYEAWKEMIDYNVRDVIGLERVYSRMAPWIENHPNVARLMNPKEYEDGTCPGCQSKNTKKKGFKATAAYVQQQWNCNECGRWFLTRLGKE